MNRQNNLWHTPDIVPFESDTFNSLDHNNLFGGSMDPVSNTNHYSNMFSSDDFFTGMNHRINSMFNNFIPNGFRDDTLLNGFNLMPSPVFMNMNMINDPNSVSHMHSSSQVMSYSNVDGKPRLIQTHDEREMGPGGVWRTRKAHRDTGKKIEKMQEGLFIGNQGEIRERFRNPENNQLEDRLYHQNVPVERRKHFVEEWNRRAEESKQRLNLPFSRNPKRLGNKHNISIQYPN